MRDGEVDQVLNSLDSLWPNSRAPLDRGARAVWGATLSRHDYQAVMRAVVELVQTSRWRPSLAEVIGRLKDHDQQRRREDAKRKALAPASETGLPPEKIKALLAPIVERVRPSRLENMASEEPRRAVGAVGERRRWGALALQVLCEQLMSGEGPAADVLDEVKRRAGE